MQDQVAALGQRGIGAVMLSSSQTGQEKQDAIRAVQNRTARLLYVAPERLRFDFSFSRALTPGEPHRAQSN